MSEDSLLAWSAQENPYPAYHRLQTEDPVHWSDPIRAWVLTRHDDVSSALKDPRFSAERVFLLRAQLRGLDPELVTDYLGVFEQSILMRDPPAHTRLRKAASFGFAPSAVESWRPTVQGVVDELIESMSSKTSVDLVTDFADALPTTIIARLFRIPQAAQSKFSEWANAMQRFFGGFGGDDIHAVAVAANDGARKLKRLFSEQAHERQSGLGDDLLSQLVRGQLEGKLSDDELASTCTFILAAGLATVSDQIANGMVALLRHPEQRTRFVEGDDRVRASAIDEMLRFDCGVPFAHRVAAEDIELRGKTIPKGHVVFLGLGPANHDPRVFPDPERFDIARTDIKELTFGGGPHYCLGASLAKLELQVALTSLFRKVPGLRLDDAHPPVVKPSLLFRGWSSIPALV